MCISDGPPMMVAPLGADHPPGGCPQQPWPVVNDDRPLPATLGGGATTCVELKVDVRRLTSGQVWGQYWNSVLFSASSPRPAAAITRGLSSGLEFTTVHACCGLTDT